MNTPALRRATRTHPTPATSSRVPAVGLRIALLVVVAASLVTGIFGGLLRAGVVLPALADAAWLGQAALSHAALMIGGFLGSVIGIERAVALRHRGAFLAPVASGLAGVCLLAGVPRAGALLLMAASLVFVAVNIALVRRQRAAHTQLLLVAALAWAWGNGLVLAGAQSVAVWPWWFAFLVLTIAAERLEMTRLMRHRPGAHAALWAVLALLLAGAAASARWPQTGGVLYGLALTLLALWLFAFDIARRTVRAHGLTRYMAVCLLSGYTWLAFAGVAWLGTALGCPGRDAALHALALGFVVSMIMGHAPVILPAIARVKLEFGGWFYVPLVLLHGSLAWRLGLLVPGAGARAQGATGNALAIALFALTVVGSALWWRQRHRRDGAGTPA